MSTHIHCVSEKTANEVKFTDTGSGDTGSGDQHRWRMRRITKTYSLT